MKKKSKQTTSPWKPAQPYILGAAGSLQDVFDKNQPQLETNAALINENLPGLASRAFSPNATLMAGQGYASDVLGGKYLTGNPYLEGMIDQTAGDVSDRVNSLFGSAGRTGGTQHVEMLTKGLADAENQLRYGDYGSERDRMGQAAALSPSLYAGEFAGVQPTVSAAMSGASLPYIGAETLAQGYGSLFGPYSTTTQKKGLGQSLMDAATAAAMAYAQSGSDPRIKENVERVGALEDGLGVYEWDYRQDMGLDLPKGRFRGVMADEVAQLRPWALGEPLPGGYATVNYGAL